MAEGGKVGEASVDIIANIVVDEESLATAEAQIQASLGKEAKPVTERGGKKQPVDVEAKVAGKAGFAKEIQTELNQFKFGIQLNTEHIRAQMEAALSKPFTITVNAEMHGAMAVATAGTAHGAAVTGGAPMGRGAPPAELEAAMYHQVKGKGRQQFAFADAIDNVYRNINEALTGAGKQRFGSQSLEPGNRIEKAAELIERYGNRVSDWIETSGPLGMPTGRGTIAEDLKSAGIDLKTLTNPSAQALATNFGGFGGENRRAGEIFIKRVDEWARQNPVAAQPAAAQERTVTERPGRVADPAIRELIAAQEEATAAAKQAVIVERQAALTATPLSSAGFPETPAARTSKLPTRSEVEKQIADQLRLRQEEPVAKHGPINDEIARLYGVLETPGKTRGPDDPETDARARRALGFDRANVRRLRGRGGVASPGGLTFDLEKYLRGAELGEFEGIFEKFGGKGFNESQGLFQLRAQDVGGQEELSRLRGLKPGTKRTMAGQEGKYARVNPSEALIRTIISDLGVGEDSPSIEEVRQYLAQGRPQEQIRQATARGGSMLRGVSGETKRGQGGVEMLAGGDAAKRLQKFDEWIEYVEDQTAYQEQKLARINMALERASKHRDTGKVQELEQASRTVATRIQQLDSGLIQAMKDREELVASAADPTGRRLSRGEQGVLNAISRESVRSGAGLTEAERHERRLASPEIQGAIGGHILREGGTSPETIRSALMQRYLANQERLEGRGGKQTMRQAAFGPTGRARRNVNAGEDAGVYGELIGAFPEDMGRESRKTASRAVYDVLSSILEDDAFKRDTAETAIRAKEGMTRGVLPGKTTASAIVTDEGVQRVAFDRPQTGEGEFLDAPGLAGRRAATNARMRAIKEGREPMPPEGSEYPYFDPDTDPGRASIENLLREREKADRTRQRTLGRGRSQTGDEVTRLARAAGIAMPDEERVPPFAAFEEKYGSGGRGPGAPGGTGGGDWGRLLMGGGGQAVPVYVTGGRLDGMGGGGGGGRPPRGRVAAGAEEPERPAETATYQIPELPADRKIGSIERAMERDFVAALRGQNDPRARQAFEKRQFDRESRYLTGAGPTPAESGFLAALQQANDPRREQAAQKTREAEVRAARRQARVNDPVGFARQRDIADTSLSEIRGENRALQRRVPRRGFGASVTDLVTSIVGRSALEDQLEAADRAQREVNEINQAAEKRSGFITQRRGVLEQARAQPAGSERRLGLLEQARELRVAASAQTAIIKESTKVFDENAKIVRKNTGAAFAAAAAGSVVSTAVGALTFGLGAAATVGLGLVIANSFEKILGDPSLRASIRTGLGDSTRAAGGRGGIAVAQLAGQAGLAAPTFERLAPALERVADIEAGNKALIDQIGILKLAEETGQRGTDAGVTKTLNGILGSWVNGTMPAAEQIGNFLGGTNVRRVGEVEFQGFEGIVPKFGEVVDMLEGDLDKFGGRIQSMNEFLGKANGSVVRFTEGIKFSDEALGKQAAELQALGAPSQLVNLIAGGTTGLVNQQTGQLVSGAEALSAISEAVAQASKPTVEALLRQTADERRAQVELQDRQRQLQLETIQPQGTAISLAQQGFGVGGPQTAGAGINLGGVSVREQKRLNNELGSTQKLYDQINKEVDTGIAAAKAFVSQTFSYDPKVGQDFAKSLDLAAGYGKEIASIQIGVQTKQAAFSAAQFAYQINIAKRSLADAKGLAGQLTDAGKDNLGVLEREQFFLQRRAQALQLELSQRQINFQRSIAGFTAPGLTGEERAARIQQAKLEADYAQKQLNIQKQLFGLGGRQFSIQASRQVTDLIGQLGLLERGRVLNVETAVAEKRIRALTLLQEKENKKVQTYYEAAVARTNDIMVLQAQMVAATGAALVTITNQVIRAFERTYEGITDVLTDGDSGSGGGGDSGGRGPGKAYGGRVMGGVAYRVTEQGKDEIFVPGADGAVHPVGDMVTPMAAPSGGGQTVIQIIVQGNKFTSEDEENRVMRKITQAVKDAQDRDFALRGLNSRN